MKSLNHCHPFPLFQSFCCSAAKKIKAKAIFTESAATESAGGEKAIKTCGAKRNGHSVRRNTAGSTV